MPDASPQDLQNILARLAAAEKKLASLESENAFLKLELERKDKIIAGLRQRIFGSSSEKIDPAQLQLLFDELVMGKPAPPPDHGGETSAPEEEKSKAPKNRRTKADRFPRNLKILVEGVLIPEEVRANPDQWIEIGEEHHDELDVIKAEIFWRRTVRKKFVHKTDKARPPVIEPAPLPSIPGTLLAPALAAQIITDKFQDHLPHYRQSQRFRRRHDIDIGRQTLNTWTHATARHLAPVGRAIRAEILQAKELEIDETPIDYQDPGHGSVREGRLWAYRDPVAGTCYFDWHAGRGAGCLLEMLGYDPETNTLAYTGQIHTDSYIVYDTIASRFGLDHGGCLAHARRKFNDLGDASPEVVIPVLLHIQRIYRVPKPPTAEILLVPAPPKQSARSMRPLWRDLILKVWGADPLQCPCCKAPMKLAGAVKRPEQVEFFLRRHGLWEGIIQLARPPTPPFDIKKRRRLVGVLDGGEAVARKVSPPDGAGESNHGAYRATQAGDQGMDPRRRTRSRLVQSSAESQ